MLIINADDFGGNALATDRILECHARGTVTSTSAMVFMKDSERAAELAATSGIDVGLHLNFSQEFDQPVSDRLTDSHERIVRFLAGSNYAQLFYHPLLRKQFRYDYEEQLAEFHRLYQRPPSHIDGHHHMHLCANMLVDRPISPGIKVRRNFSFWPGEKSPVNRTYRAFCDKWLRRRYRTTDYLFSLPQRLQLGNLPRALELAARADVELETHPEVDEDFAWLTRKASQALGGLTLGTYAQL